MQWHRWVKFHTLAAGWKIFGGSDWTAENDAALTKLSQVGVSARVEEEKGGKERRRRMRVEARRGPEY